MSNLATQEDIHNEFSLLRFFKHFQQKLTVIDTYPLTTDNLVIQQDAYKRLGNGEGFIPEEPFATLEMSKKTNDKVIRFSLSFFEEFVSVDIEYFGIMRFYYDNILSGYSDFMAKKNKNKTKQLAVSIKKLEQFVADQLFMLCMVLSNGQLCINQTFAEGYMCAVETILVRMPQEMPIVLTTHAEYSWWWSASKNDYDNHLVANAFIKELIKIPDYFLLFDYDDELQPRNNGRSFASIQDLRPLTKGEFAVLNKELHIKYLSDNKLGERFSVLSMWEFYLLTTWYVGVVGLGLYKHWFFDFLQNHPIIFAALGLPFVSILAEYLQLKKLSLKETRPDHPYLAFDNFVKKKPKSLFTTSALSLLFVYCLIPMYAVDDTHKVTFMSYVLKSPYLLLWPISLLVGAVLSRIQKWWAKITVLLLSFVGFAVYLAFDSAYPLANEKGTSLSVVNGVLTLALPLLTIMNVVTYLPVRKLEKLRRINEKVLQKYRRRVEAIKTAEKVLCFLGGLGTLFGTVLYFSHVPQEFAQLPPIVLAIAGYVLGVAQLMVCIAFVKNKLQEEVYAYIAVLFFFAAMLLPAYSVKDGASDNAMSLAYTVLIAGNFISLFITAVRGIYEGRENEEMYRQDKLR